MYCMHMASLVLAFSVRFIIPTIARPNEQIIWMEIDFVLCFFLFICSPIHNLATWQKVFCAGAACHLIHSNCTEHHGSVIDEITTRTRRTCERSGIQRWCASTGNIYVINSFRYWQMTAKGFMAHTNCVIMKTDRKYLVVNWLRLGKETWLMRGYHVPTGRQKERRGTRFHLVFSLYANQMTSHECHKN